MTKKTLYRYKDGEQTVVSPIQPAEGIDFDILFRIIADEGKLLHKDDRTVYCLDVEVEDAYGWEEIDDPDYIPPEDEGAPSTED